MNISSLLYSFPGIYMTQAFTHSIIAAIIVDRAIHTWDITNPLIKQRFRLLIIILPIFLFPIYQIINPDRGSISFRLGAFLDINRWLNLELWGKVPLSIFFVLVLFITSLIFFLQEMIPIIRHSIESKKSGPEFERPDSDSIVSRILASLPGEKPDIFILDDDDLLLFSTTGKNQAIYLSQGLLDILDPEQIEAALAHEIAHIARNKRPLLIAVFFLRVLMFFNPVVLLEFRKIVQEEEKICDDIAVALTNKPHALSETLKKFYHKGEDTQPMDIKKLSKLPKIGDSLEEYSHNLHLHGRVSRLENGPTPKTDNEWCGFIFAIAVISAVNYFIV